MKNKQPVSDYFKKNLFFTIETEEPELPDSIELLGAIAVSVCDRLSARRSRAAA